MYLDQTLMFSDEQDLSQVAGTYLSDKSIDLGVAGSIPQGGSTIFDVGPGQSLSVLCQVIEAFTSAGSTGTVQVQLVMADNEALSTNLVVLQETAAIVVTTLVQGYQFRLGALPQGITKGFLGLRYLVAVQTTTAGTITAGLVRDLQQSF
jgi:hypothetical protein